jgi:streptomycin 6-kinase
MFGPYLARWNLVPDGAPIITRAACQLPVLRSGEPAMLKLAHEKDERLGGELMERRGGDGAARVLARDDAALLLERAMGTAFLADMARSGRDDEACRILCATASRLHTPRSKPLPEMIPLKVWFQDLEPTASAHGGIFARCAARGGSALRRPAPRQRAQLRRAWLVGD